MKDKFSSYYQKNNLFLKTDKVLLAVSGGKDSMAMLHLFMVNELSFGIAHCNFNLRGKNSTEDQYFVSEFAKKHNIPFYTIDFDTEKYAAVEGVSIQMAARDLRYTWFEKVRKEYDYNYFATAHHKNDVAETMLINMTKGTGLAGLHGIRNKNGFLVRPMLDFSSVEINEYIESNSLSFREDISNSDTKYTRNAIRHRVIPELKKLNPAVIETLNIESNRFLGDEKIISDKISLDRAELFIQVATGFKISIDALKEFDPLNAYLYYFFRDYGFNFSDISALIKVLDKESGKQFFSKTHRIVKGRKFLFLNEIEEKIEEDFFIRSFEDFPFSHKIIDITPDFKIETSSNNAYLDADKIQYPMILRNWKEGDFFQPLGMNGKKKISDFLIDNKISFVNKEKINVLEANGDILWLVGQRINDKYKITPNTKRVLALKTN